MVADVCQKVIVPVLYSRGKKDYYKLKAADVKDVLKYRALRPGPKSEVLTI